MPQQNKGYNMQHHFTTDRLEIFQSMIASAIREGLTFEAFEIVNEEDLIDYVINYTGGHG
jgi:hypothetical protein